MPCPQGALCHRLEEHVLSLEAHVDGATANLPQHRKPQDKGLSVPLVSLNIMYLYIYS